MIEPDFTQSRDCRDWTEAFIERVKKNPSIATDEGTMMGWFANAIERGYDEGLKHGNAQSPKPNQRLEIFAVVARNFYIGSRLTRADVEQWVKELAEERPSWPPLKIVRMVAINDEEEIVRTDIYNTLWDTLTETQQRLAELRALVKRYNAL